MIIRYPTGTVISGKNEVQKANVGDGYVHGIELQTGYDLTPDWRAFGGLAWQEGYADTYPTAAKIRKREPMSRIAPLTSLLGLRYEPQEKDYWIEATARMAAKQDKLPTSDKADTDRIPPGGTPGYAVYGIRGGVNLTKNITLSAGVENITDVDYRIHGSSHNAPRTNSH